MHTGLWWGGHQGRRPLGRPRRKCKNNIKTDFKYKVRGVNWIDVGEDGTSGSLL